MKKYIFFLILCCLSAALFARQSLANQTRVLDLRYGPHIEKERLVLDFTNRVASEVTHNADTSELYIDVPILEWRTALDEQFALGPVKNIKLLPLQNNKLRIIFNLEKEATLQQSFWLPASGDLRDRLVIDLVTGSNNKKHEKEDKSDTANKDNKNIDDLLENIVSSAGDADRDVSEVPKTIDVHTIAGIVVPQRKPNNLKKARASYKPVIVIDAGHGGKDPGAIAKNGQLEKDIVMKLSREIRDHLNETGRYDVKLTREKDHFIKLRDRVRMAKKKGADVFISIHADSIPDRKVTGASVYTLSEKSSDEQTAKLAARENKADLISGVDLSHEDKEVANILLDLVTRDTTNQSKFFANLLVENFEKQDVKLLKKAHRHAGFAVLKAPDIPSVLIESGFISSPKEVQKLNNKEHRKKIVRSIEGALDTYFLRLASFRAHP